MPQAQTYQSEFTGLEMDARFTAVAQLTAALEALTTVVAQKYVKPANGIPSTDMDADVQAALAKANTAVQSLADYYTKSEVDQLLAAINGMDYVDVATLPTASASTLGKIYLVGPDASGYYAYYYTSYDGSAYSWVGPLGTTQISLANYATKAELSALDREVIDLKRDTKGIFADSYSDTFYIADDAGNVIAKIDKDGLFTTLLSARNVDKNAWGDKVVATYGDSITAVNNGDFSRPFTITQNNWGNRVADYLQMLKQYGRGIGSTTFMWRNGHGGQVAWCNSLTGEYVGRDDSYNYDNYVGHVTIPEGCTAVRGDGCSWLRITTMFPASIKDTIDAVLVQFHNDYHQDMGTGVQFIENDTSDPEWAASSQYAVLGGDYNIATVQGGIASTIMKLQAWMPNAKIILMTPISGVYSTADGLDGNFDNAQSALMFSLRNVVADIAARMSISCIDVYGNDGINSLNRTSYIYDNIHPYTAKGSKAIAAAVIGQLKQIIPAL